MPNVQPPDPNPMSTINLILPSELRNRFKAACALRGVKMRETLIALIEATLEPPAVDPRTRPPAKSPAADPGDSQRSDE